MDPALAYLLLTLLACVAACLSYVAAQPGRHLFGGGSPCAVLAGGATLAHVAHSSRGDRFLGHRPRWWRWHIPRSGVPRSPESMDRPAAILLSTRRPEAASWSPGRTKCSPIREARIRSARPDPLSA